MQPQKPKQKPSPATRRATKRAIKAKPSQKKPKPIVIRSGACISLPPFETGKNYVLWLDASGELRLLECPAGSKLLRGDSNGPFWSNT